MTKLPETLDQLIKCENVYWVGRSISYVDVKKVENDFPDTRFF